MTPKKPETEALPVAAEAREPLAIVGIGCRYPGGVDGPDALWKLLCDAVDASIEIPPDRYDIRQHYNPDPEVPGKTAVSRAGFISQPIDRFDSSFFGILPREADSLDPQQRMLLECLWEALEDAGLVADELAGSRTGVYVGAFTFDHTLNVTNPNNRHLINPNTATCMSATLLSNRLSYTYDFRGPSFTVNTACSSSLVTFHYACQDLWAGVTDLALAGGTNLMLRPEYPMAMSKGGFLAADGRSKSFDDRADGYGRGDGVGLVAIRRLSDAVRDGNPIYALVKGSGVNQDGRTNGITVPNIDAQQALIQEVYTKYDIDPAKTVYVEAHGTGTPVGDPIEAHAIGRVLGANRPEDKAVFIGSLKANIGHTEAAAGIAGVIKAALCLKNMAVPPQVNLINPNPHIPFEELRLKLPRKVEPLERNGGPAQASINSFGYGGTNGHAVLAEPPAAEPVEGGEPADGVPFVTPISARDTDALKALAGRYAEFLDDPAVSLNAFRNSATYHRCHHDHRLAMIAESRAELIEKLKTFAAGDPVPFAVQGRAPRNAPKRKLSFVFTGMGPQWWGMGRELMRTEPVFRAKAEEIDAIFTRIAGWSILEQMAKDEDSSEITSNQYAQPANFVIQVALAEVLKTMGITPDVVVGHSVGEVSAAHIAGALSLEDAVLVSYHRSRAQQKAAGKGKMLAVGLGSDVAEGLLESYEGKVGVAAANSPTSCTLAGDPDALEEIAAVLQEEGVFNRMLTVEVAYHSPHMDPLKDDILASMAGLSPTAPTVPLYSTVTGKRVEEAFHDAHYWWCNVRQTVLFAETIAAMAADGCDLFLEVGPHPVLGVSIKECLRAADVKGGTIQTLHRKQPERASLLETVGQLYALGQPVDWQLFVPRTKGFLKLPHYPWQRQFHYLESAECKADRTGWEGHPLLGRRQPLPTPTWQTEVTTQFLPYLNDHQIGSSVVLPGACYVEAALAAARELSGQSAVAIEDVRLMRALMVVPRDLPRLRLEVNPKDQTFGISSRAVHDGTEWAQHAIGRLLQAIGQVGLEPLDIEGVKARCPVIVEPADFYGTMSQRGLNYGPNFQGVRRIWAGQGEVLAEVETLEQFDPTAESYGLHPTLLDAAFQALIGALGDQSGMDDGAYVPVRLGRVALFGTVTAKLWVYGKVTKANSRFIDGDILLADADGNIVARVDRLRCQSLSGGVDGEKNRLKNWLYEYRWDALETPLAAEAGEVGRWLVLADGSGFATTLIADLEGRGGQVIAVTPGAGFESTETGYAIDPDAKADMLALLDTVDDGTLTGVVSLWGLDADATDPDGTKAATTLLHLAQGMVRETAPRQSGDPAPRVVVVTRGGQSVGLDGELVELAQTALWGLTRVAMNELPHLRCRLIDLDPAATDIAGLADVILSGSKEDEVALRSGAMFVHRLDRVPEPDETAGKEMKSADTPFVLELGNRGPSDAIRFRETSRKEPGPGEVEVRINRVALTFKDGLKLIGRLSSDITEGTYFGDNMGMEGLGTVVRLGAGVEALDVGELVTIVPPTGLYRSYVTVDQGSVFRIPHMSDDMKRHFAVQVVEFMTAYHGLHNIARMQRGETVLLHSATGGVGLAAIQVAQWLGAEIFATAGNDEKRDLLRSLGVKHVFDSRSLDFYDQIREATGGRGVDVVLNFLTGESLVKSLAVLAPFGRFIEIGKRDIDENNNLPLKYFNENLIFASIDIDRLILQNRKIFWDTAFEIHKGFREGYFKPVTEMTFPVAELGAAFQLMLQAKHIGKVVVEMDQGEVPVLPAPVTGPLFKADGTYVITGGFGGFGLEIAKWMAEEGAGALVLVGRKGAATDEAKAAVAALEEKGVKILPAACDVADRAAVERMLGEVRASGLPPLRGIMHAATVLDDGLMTAMDGERMARVMGPKALGALHLDALTRGDPIEVFVNFSSVSSMIGNVGQANYVTANAVLDGLAFRRRAEGLPALTVNWGVLGEVGVAARNTDLMAQLDRVGIKAMAPRHAVGVLKHLLRDGKLGQVGVMDVDWRIYSKANPAMQRSARFSILAGALGGGESSEYVKALRDADPAEREALMISILTGEVSKILRIPVNKLDPNASLATLGVDSLMAVELQTGIQMIFGVELTTLEITSSNGVASIAALMLERMGLSTSGGGAAAPANDEPAPVREAAE
jgi:acyl transferase domain-containing protein/acyl carrier protein